MTLRNDLPAQETPESVQCSFGRAARRWVSGRPKPTLFIPPDVIDLTRRDATRSACVNLEQYFARKGLKEKLF